MGSNIKVEDTAQFQELKNSEIMTSDISSRGLVVDPLLETLQTNLLVLEGLQNRCAFVMKEIRYLMKVDENK